MLYYSWIIPFGIFALIVLLAYSRFLLALPRRTGLIFFLSGAVFVTGTIGFEMFEGQINEAGGYRSFDYMVLVTVEEILEMVGILGFIYGLLNHLTAEGRPLKMSLVKWCLPGRTSSQAPSTPLPPTRQSRFASPDRVRS